jgi:hypothetical protein
MHQQPPQAPDLPKRDKKSCQRASLSGKNSALSPGVFLLFIFLSSILHFSHSPVLHSYRIAVAFRYTDLLSEKGNKSGADIKELFAGR